MVSISLLYSIVEKFWHFLQISYPFALKVKCLGFSDLHIEQLHTYFNINLSYIVLYVIKDIANDSQSGVKPYLSWMEDHVFQPIIPMYNGSPSFFYWYVGRQPFNEVICLWYRG